MSFDDFDEKYLQDLEPGDYEEQYIDNEIVGNKEQTKIYIKLTSKQTITYETLAATLLHMAKKLYEEYIEPMEENSKITKQ